MTIGLAIGTVTGACIFPFLVRMMWDKMIKAWGAIGGLTAVIFIVLLSWCLNHGANNAFIYQSGKIWVDQALGVAVGLMVVTKLKGCSLKKGLPTIISGILGGIFAGFIIYGTLIK